MAFDNLTIRYVEGVLKAKYDYYPYGLTWGQTTTAYNENYAGLEFQNNEWFDPNLGGGLDLVHFAARMYDPILGRWHSPDPMEQFHSPYLAMCDNPANFVDPDGRAGIPWLQDFMESDVGFFCQWAVSTAAIVGGFSALQSVSAIGGTLKTVCSLGLSAASAAGTLSQLKSCAHIAEHSSEVYSNGSTNATSNTLCYTQGSASNALINGGEQFKLKGKVSEKSFQFSTPEGNTIFFDTPVLEQFDGVYEWMLVRFWQTQAYSDLRAALSTSGEFDLYFSFEYTGSSFDNEGFQTGGQAGRFDSKNYISKKDWNNAVGGKDLMSIHLEESVMTSYESGKKVLFIFIDLSYLNQMYLNSVSLDKNLLPNTMEDMISVYVHEIHAHCINFIVGNSKGGFQEHAEYNYDRKYGEISPRYKECPLDGKSGQSLDKLNIQEVMKYFRAAWKNY